MASYGSIQQDTAINGKPQNEDKGEDTPLIQSDDGEFFGIFSGTKARDHSFWSMLTFKWFTPILHRGNDQKKLDQDDLELVPLPQDCKTDEISAKFDQHWNEELLGKNPSLVRALWRAFGADYLRGSALKLVHDLCIFVGPQVLHAIIVFLRDPNGPLWWGLSLVLAITLSQLLMSICLRHYFFKVSAGLAVKS
jgi:ATP-binding cassette subfamily C (CFTR/MRP) protein 1